MQSDVTKLFRVRHSSSGKENAMQFAFRTVYKKSNFLQHLPTGTKKPWGYYFIDSHLKESWMESLNNIDEIDIRSTCEGHGSNYPTHIIFRPKHQDPDYIDNIISKLENKGFKCLSDIGNANQYRICVAINNWYRLDANNDKWEKWWEKVVKFLPEIVKR